MMTTLIIDINPDSNLKAYSPSFWLTVRRTAQLFRCVVG